MRPRFLPNALALAVGVAIVLAALRPVWLPSELMRGQYQRAYFELLDGTPGLALDEARGGYMSPDVDLDGNGRLSVPPGRTIAVPIEEGVEYVITNEGRPRSPYVAVGFEVPMAAGVDASTEFPPQAFRQPRVLELRDGALTWRPWDAARTWADDRVWLEALTDACRDGMGNAALSLHREGELLTARLGRCAVRSELPAAPAGGRIAMAVVAGPNWAAVEIPRGGWPTARHTAWWFIATAIAVVVLLRVGVGLLLTLILSIWVGLLGLFGIVPALLGLALSCAAGMVGALWAATGRAFRARPGARAATFAALCAALFVLPIAFAFRLGNVAAHGREVRVERARNVCELIGYSTVRGDALRYGTVGAWAYLDGPCAACSGTTARYAKEAQTIDWVRDTACAPSFAPQPGGVLVFLGGGNDDFFWRKSAVRQASRFLGLLYYAYQRPDEQTWQHFLNATSEGSLLMIEPQTAAVRELAQCVHARGQRLLFAHDFLMWDIENGRSPPRQAMLEHRRGAVESNGGQFLDLLQALGPRAGVSWFNDFIHPSAVGHLRIAELICDAIAARGSVRAEAGTP
jgi:hypothetical protein